MKRLMDLRAVPPKPKDSAGGCDRPSHLESLLNAQVQGKKISYTCSLTCEPSQHTNLSLALAKCSEDCALPKPNSQVLTKKRKMDRQLCDLQLATHSRGGIAEALRIAMHRENSSVITRKHTVAETIGARLGAVFANSRFTLLVEIIVRTNGVVCNVRA